MMNIAILCLAAGGASRMGQAKQLLPWGERTVLQAALRPLSDIACAPKVLVLGAYADEISSSLQNWPERAHWQVALNERWAEGMASSLVTGVRFLIDWERCRDIELEGVMICLGDMPTLEKPGLEKLMAELSKRGKRAIVAPVFAGRRGHPVLMGRTYWDEMLALQGDCGAASILRRYSDNVVLVPAPGAVAEDIDTPEQWRELSNKRLSPRD